MLKETDEPFRQMTIGDYYDKEVTPALFAVSKVFAEAKKQMNLSEYKAFTLALTKVKWKDDCPDTLYLDKKEVAQVVGIKSDPDHLSVDLYRAIGELPHHSFLRFADKDKDMYVNGNFVRTIAFFKNVVRIRLEPDFLGLFGNLNKNYITMWSKDIFQMHTERAVKFYELLRSNSEKTEGTFGIRTLKELFEIPKDGAGSYVKSNGHFDRYNFERYVIDPVCKELTDTKMIQLVIQPNGKYYEKIKRGNRVIAYKVNWTLSLYPRVATAAEVKEIQEKVDKDPQTLKVSKDILKGQKKRSKKNLDNQTENHSPSYKDLDDLEKQLLKKQDEEYRKSHPDTIQNNYKS